MKIKNWLHIFTIIFQGILVCMSQLLIKSYRHCQPNFNYGCFHNFTFTTEDHKQYMDGTAIITSPFDNTIRTNVSVQMLMGNRYVHLPSIYEKKSCDAVHKYVGEFIYDMERAGQVIPGMCPIPQGRYHWHHYLLDFKKITTLSNFPFGNLRFTLIAFDSNNNIYTCIMFEVEHTI